MVWPSQKLWDHSQFPPQPSNQKDLLHSTFSTHPDCPGPPVSLQTSFSSYANSSSALLPVIFLKTKSDHIFPCLKPFNGSLLVQFSFPNIRVLYNLTTTHTPLSVALIYTQPLLHKHIELLTGFWMPQALSLLSSHSVPTVWHSFSFFNWKTHINFQDLAEMSPFHEAMQSRFIFLSTSIAMHFYLLNTEGQALELQEEDIGTHIPQSFQCISLTDK